MSPPPTVLPPGVDELLKALREAGLPVGTREVFRLHRVFSLEPGESRTDTEEAKDSLELLLLAVLVHSPDERRVFEPIYREWRDRWRQWEAVGQREEPADLPPERIPLSRRRKRSRRRIRWASRLGITVIALAALFLRSPSIPPPTVLPLPQPPPQPTTENPFTEDGFRLLPPEPVPETRTIWVPSIRVDQPGGLAIGSFPVLGLGFLVTGTALAVWGFKRRRRSPRRLTPPSLPGPKRVPYLPLPNTGPDLLDADGARTLVWGVGRHRTENLTPEIDLDRTADATARSAGMPVLRHVPESRLREVWLWLDGATDDPRLERYAEEIAASLEQNGLPVRIGSFDGYPEELVWDEGQRFRPAELEGHRQSALVAVMTDGDVLRRHARDNRRESVAALLRALASWERLAFVDFSERGDLAAEVERYGIACVEPRALPEFFGVGSAPARERRPPEPSKLHLWAAALAMAPRPVDRRDAHALRRELGLDVSPWAIRELAPAGAFGVHVDLGGEEARKLHWLRHAEEDGTVEEHALSFWERRLAEEDRRRSARGGLESWRERPGRRYLEMERALLKLRRDPEKASEELAALAALDEGLGLEIRHRLDGCGDATTIVERIPLPWRFGSLPDTVRQRLRELGLEVGLGRLRPPGRLVLAVGVLWGLGTTTLLSGGLRHTMPPKIDCDDVPASAFCYPDLDNGRLYAGARSAAGSELLIRRVERGQGGRVVWKSQDVSCIADLDGIEIWRCSRDTTIRLSQTWSRRRLAVLEFPVQTPSARSFAETLLSGGNVDALLLGSDAEHRLVDLTGSPGVWQGDEELLWFAPVGSASEPVLTNRFGGKSVVLEVVDLPRLKDALEGLRTATKVADLQTDLANVRWGDRSLKLHYCPKLRGMHEETGMPFAWVCGGQFRMGSEDDPAAAEDEKPAHDVALTGFWIGEREVSNAEVRRKKDHPGEDEMPANLNWFDARDFCRSLGQSEEWEYDLPSEAQWEFAARGNTGRRYPWGDDEPTKDLAVFGRGFDSLPEGVGSLPEVRGPFGTLDQAGNVFEWNLDCYDSNIYKERERAGTIAENPAVVEPEECETLKAQLGTPSALRVLRGGSFDVGPGWLRSAFRDRNRPEARYEFIGFRCVRSPRSPP